MLIDEPTTPYDVRLFAGWNAVGALAVPTEVSNIEFTSFEGNPIPTLVGEVYRYVTIPLLWPGIFSAAIFSFLLSWGNFYLTYSLAGAARTLPTFVFSGIATGSSPLYPAMATVVFVPGIVLVMVADALRRRAARRLA